MRDAEWAYHLTGRQVAVRIKAAGMNSALLRIGTAVAHPGGAFEQNRKAMQETKFKQRLTAYLAQMISRGNTKEQVAAINGNYVPFAFAPVGSNDVDQPLLEGIVDRLLAQYALLLPNNGARPRAADVRRNVEVQDLASAMLRTNKNHFLARLAVQYEAYRYRIEETITARHVYFFKPANARGAYMDYKRHLDNPDIVVLRVLQSDVPGLVQDDSDANAFMTPNPVPPGVLEIMVNHDGFGDEDYRCDPGNWQRLTDWQ